MKLKYFGHLMRRKDSLERSLMLGTIDGKRRRGRQRMRWLDGVTEAVGVSLSGLWGMVEDRKAWRNVVRGVTMGDQNALRNILLYHLIRGVFIGNGFEPGVTNILKTIQGGKLYLKLVNNTLLVNELQSKEPDLMATNGVIHVIDKLLYPADVPVGNDELLTILKKLIKYIQIKHVRGSTFKEIPLTFYTTRIITKVVDPSTKVIESSFEPILRKEDIKKITRVVGGTTIRKEIEVPSITKLTKVTEGEPEFKLIREGETVTKVIHGEPIIKKYTKIIDGHPVEVTEREVTEERIIQGPELKYTQITTGGRADTEETLKKLLDEEVAKVTKRIEGADHLLEDEEIKRLLQGDCEILFRQNVSEESHLLKKCIKNTQREGLRVDTYPLTLVKL
ncbi:Periostin [Varanus komodoensis]|nr:Periostin [Varanus komodoensis]